MFALDSVVVFYVSHTADQCNTQIYFAVMQVFDAPGPLMDNHSWICVKAEGV